MGLLTAVLIGYLIGALPFGYLIARSKGIDIRSHGSGNIGATNVGRVLGFRFFLLTFALDFFKGVLPVAGFLYLSTTSSASAAWQFTPELAGLAAILGHMFPVYLGFRGGKGVATTIGVLITLLPMAVAVGLAAWAVGLLLTRMVSASSMMFAVVLAATYFTMSDAPTGSEHLPRTIIVVAIVLLIFVRHRSNLRRIFAGTEPQVRFPWEKGRA